MANFKRACTTSCDVGRPWSRSAFRLSGRDSDSHSDANNAANAAPWEKPTTASIGPDDSTTAASVASGSYRTDGMLIVPCSAGTLAKVAGGFADNLLSRAAHVTLKERRPLVLVLREDPLPRPMLTNMLAAHDAGATLMTASPGFYHAPETVEELLHFVTARVLDQFGLDVPGFRRWKDPEA